MAKTDATGAKSILPATEDQIIETITRIAPSRGVADAQKCWRIGEMLQQLRATNPDGPVAVVSSGTGICDRELRYCMKVHAVFSSAQVDALVQKGMCWSTLREMAGNSLAPHRDQLIKDFESHCGTDIRSRRSANAALRAEVRILRKGGSGAGKKDEAGSVPRSGVHRAMAGVESRSRELGRDLVKAGNVLRRAVDAGLPLRPEALARVRAMNAALQTLVEEAQALLQQSSALTGDKRIPLRKPKKARKRTTKYSAPKAVHAKDQKRRG
jgi:hypothetical protein